METTREIYKRKYEAQLKEWAAKVDGLKARAEKLTAEAQLDLKPRTEAATLKFEAAKAKLRELADATDDSWQNVKKDADALWTDTKASVEGALDALKTKH